MFYIILIVYSMWLMNLKQLHRKNRTQSTAKFLAENYKARKSSLLGAQQHLSIRNLYVLNVLND